MVLLVRVSHLAIHRHDDRRPGQIINKPMAAVTYSNTGYGECAKLLLAGISCTFQSTVSILKSVGFLLR
jgi:hypothetical protein